MLTLFGARLYPPKVLMWHLNSHALILFQTCENISTHYCSLEHTVEALPLTPRRWIVTIVSSPVSSPLFLWVVADYHVFLISDIHRIPHKHSTGTEEQHFLKIHTALAVLDGCWADSNLLNVIEVTFWSLFVFFGGMHISVANPKPVQGRAVSLFPP